MTASIFILVLIAGLWPAESSAVEKLDLKLRLKPGQRFGVRLTTELYRGDESFEFERGMGFEVKEVDANGIVSIEVTFRTLQIKVTREEYHVEYDSTKQSIADDYSKIHEIAIDAASVGESFITRVTAKGKIIEIKGLEEMYSRMYEKVEEWNEKYLKLELVPCGKKQTCSSRETTVPPTTLSWKEMSESTKKVWREVRRHNIKSSYSEEEIRNMLSDMIMAFPEQPLAIGDSWTDKVKIWGKNHEIDGTYTLKDIEKGTVAVDLSAKRTAEEETFSWVNNEGRTVGFKIVGSCKGRFEVDKQTGWLVRSKIKARFTGEVIDEEANNEMTQPILKEELITVEPME